MDIEIGVHRASEACKDISTAEVTQRHHQHHSNTETAEEKVISDSGGSPALSNKSTNKPAASSSGAGTTADAIAWSANEKINTPEKTQLRNTAATILLHRKPGSGGHHHQYHSHQPDGVMGSVGGSPSHRSSFEKLPRRKAPKSESRRRRERKMIANGEMEVQQANETLMRYLRQCTEINDASLSGELEIDNSYDDRKVYRKTRSQREKRAMLPSSAAVAKSIAASGGTAASCRNKGQLKNGLTNILNTLVDDIVPNNGEIYNPFTPVISPIEETQLGFNKMLVKTARAYTPSASNIYKLGPETASESTRKCVQNVIEVSCQMQKCWIQFADLCHGFLGGLALAHLIITLTTNPYDWLTGAPQKFSLLGDTYVNTMYFLTVVCLVSIVDRIDFCRIHSNTPGSISFRSIIILMIYLACLILSLTTESSIERLDLSGFNSTIWIEQMDSNRVLSVWNSLSIVRSVSAIAGWILIGILPDNEMLYEQQSPHN